MDPYAAPLASLLRFPEKFPPCEGSRGIGTRWGKIVPKLPMSVFFCTPPDEMRFLHKKQTNGLYDLMNFESTF